MSNIVTQIWAHPANRSNRAATLLRAMLWQCQKRLSAKPKDLAYHGLTLRCPADSRSASRAIYFSCLPDYWEMRFMQDYLRPADVFVDVGANIGLYTLLARSLVGSEGHIFCFEPNIEMAHKLQITIELNKLQNISVYQMGLGDEPGSSVLDLSGDDCTAHIADVNSANTTQKIDIVRLDQQLKDTEITLAKFDVEGYEPFAIRGAASLLADDNPPVMLIEMGGLATRYGVVTADFIAELDRSGYFTAIYRPQTRELIETERPWEIPVENVLAISKNARQFVERRLQH